MTNMNTAVAVVENKTKTTNTKFYDFAKELEKKTFPYKGKKNKTDFPEFVNICKMSAKKLKQYLCKKVKEFYDKKDIIAGNGYLYCRGSVPVLLTAHMDTVHKELIKDFYEDVKIDMKGNVTHTISSPQGIGGDDRCGIYAILQILETGYLPYVLFCEDEEIGGVGSEKFCNTEYIEELETMKFLLELDRANANDLVFYSNGNQEWKNWIKEKTNWTESWGTFSDICNLSPICGVSSVNLSCGYYKQHTLQEYVIIEEMLEMIEVVKHLLDVSDKVNTFEYVAQRSTNRYYNYGYNYYGFDNSNSISFDDDDDDYYYTSYYKSAAKEKEYWYDLEVYYYDKDNKEQYAVAKGRSEAECWMNFFFDYFDVCFEQVIDYYLY